MNITIRSVGKPERKIFKTRNRRIRNACSYRKVLCHGSTDEKAPENLIKRWETSARKKEGERILSKIKDGDVVKGDGGR